MYFQLLPDGERHVIAWTSICQHMPKSIYKCKNLYIQISIITLHHTCKNCLGNNLNNENFHNKLHNAMAWKHKYIFLKYHWNLKFSEILQGVLHMNNILDYCWNIILTHLWRQLKFNISQIKWNQFFGCVRARRIMSLPSWKN